MRALAIIALLLAPPAFAYPDGPPWGHSGNGADCTACHFDHAATPQSGALALDGLPAAWRKGKVYRLTLRLRAEAARAGFQISAVTAAGRPANAWRALDDRVEAGPDGARSTMAGSKDRQWTIEWTAPADGGEIWFHAAANAANQDGSPFGDAIHVRQWRLAPD